MEQRQDASVLAKARDRCSQMGFPGIPELLHEGMALERLLDDPALNTLAASMNEANLAQPCLVRCSDIFVNDGLDVTGRERVEIE